MEGLQYPGRLVVRDLDDKGSQILDDVLCGG